MNVTIPIGSAMCTLLLTSCANWPEEGRGGFAEHNAAPYYPIHYIPYANTTGNNAYPLEAGAEYSQPHDHTTNTTDSHLYHDTPQPRYAYDSHQYSAAKKHHLVTSAQGLRLDTDVSRNVLDTLILQGAKVCFPAAVHNVTLRQYRIERELAGGLLYDASLNIQMQRFELDILRQQVNLINPEGLMNTAKCVQPLLGADQMAAKVQAAAQKNEQLLSLLNSDNQFATNSSALNPKYAARLAKASQALNTDSHIKLIISGHTDDIGDKQHNQTLALARAKTVANFLIGLDVNASRLQVKAVAETQPLSTANGVEHRLVNRRVLITLANSDSSAITVIH